MKSKIGISVFVCLCCTWSLQAQQFRFTDGLYRIPYSIGTSVKVITNVWDHAPKGCYDLNRVGSIGNFNIVAAAGGWIRAIRDHYFVTCGGANCCNEYNNYIILQHLNGEWSSYIHLRQYSITNLGHEVGDWVDVGTVLGLEGDVGCATGSHLHLEVSRPRDTTNAFDPYDGVLRRNGELLNPVFCSEPGGYLLSGSTYTAGNCSHDCPANQNSFGTITNQVLRADNTISSIVEFNSGGTGMYRAGTEIVLLPGFAAKSGVMFTAQIKTCNQQ